MFHRKAFVLATSALVMGAALTGLTRADDESPLHKIMEQVQSHNSVILKGVRNKVNFTKSQADVVASARKLAELGKEARKITTTPEEQKQPVAKWESLMDEYIKESEGFAKTAEAKTATFDQAKTAYKAVQKTCTGCHDVFRVEE